MPEQGPESQPLSLLLRQGKKAQRQKVGVTCLVIGGVLLAIGVHAFVRGGADILGMWGVAFGLGLLGVGAFTLRKAATSRW